MRCYALSFLMIALALPAGANEYRLRSDANLQEGCFEPCLCPIRLREMRGGFRLVPKGHDGLFWNYDVETVQFVVTVDDAPFILRGAGLYRVGGEVAVQQQLTLELTDTRGDARTFDSGLVIGGGRFPEIDVAAAVNGFFCFDTVVDVKARPQLTLVPIASDNTSGTTWGWEAVHGASGYDVVSGDLTALRETRGDFSRATTHCPVNDTAGTEVSLDEVPEPGHADWYLLRYRQFDARGSWDSDDPGQFASRDAGIDAAPGACY